MAAAAINDNAAAVVRQPYKFQPRIPSAMAGFFCIQFPFIPKNYYLCAVKPCTMHTFLMQYGSLTAPSPLKTKTSPVAPPYCINYQSLIKTRFSDIGSRGQCLGIVRRRGQAQPILGETFGGCGQHQPMFGETFGGCGQHQPMLGETFRRCGQHQPVLGETFRRCGQPLRVIARNEAIQKSGLLSGLPRSARNDAKRVFRLPLSPLRGGSAMRVWEQSPAILESLNLEIFKS